MNDERREAVKSCLEQGITSVPAISTETGIPRTSVQRALEALRRERAREAEKPEHTWEEAGNAAHATAALPEPTLEALLKRCEVDTDVWDVERWTVNSYEMGAKVASYTRDGTKTGETVQTIPLWKVQAWFVRRIAVVTAFPTIAPISIKVSQRKQTSHKRTERLKTCLIIPDSQNGYLRSQDAYGKETLEPFHDRLAWDAVIQLAKRLKPDRIVMLGDMLDLPDWSDKFLRSPEMYFTTQPALIELAWLLARVRQAAPGATISYLEGNHEARMRNALCAHLTAAYGIRAANAPESAPAMSVPSLLGLAQLGIEYHGPYPEGELWLNSNLSVGHGETVRSGSGDTVKAILKELRSSHICGHIHRCEQASETRYFRGGPRTYVCMSPGTIARLDGPIPRAKQRMNWSQGCAVVRYEESSGGPDRVDKAKGRDYFQTLPIPIWGGRLIWGESIIQGDDYVPQLNKETGWAF
jgi:hypothetical protein